MARVDDSLKMLREHAKWLQLYLNASRDENSELHQRMEQLEQQLADLRAENQRFRQQIEELTRAAHQAAEAGKTPADPPDFVKPSVPTKTRQRPGRKPGHRPDHRPEPQTIDSHIQLPLPRDAQGQTSCPKCHTQLSDYQEHQRIVEDIIPAKVVVTCYHTQSGYCPHCRRRIESRAPEQPPAASIAPSQLGINALTTAALLRVHYRLPFRLITDLFADLPGLCISPATVARQLQRMGDWLEGQYDRLKIFLRASPVVHMDETGWRTDGVNGWLWTMLNDTHTVYHVDRSRSRKVVEQLLGQVFGGTLVSDFYSAYAGIDCRKQKCLVHLLRELRDSAAKSADFAAGRFHRRCKRLIKDMLALKKQHDEIPAQVYQRRARRMDKRLANLATTQWDEAHAQRLAGRLQRHGKELTGFLWDPAVPADNNAAERGLRPAVVMRKITGGSRSQRGGQSWAVMASIVRTARQQHRPLIETLQTLLKASWAGENPTLLTDALAEMS